MLHDSSYYNAFAARDQRFDGVFFVGVTSTGIYCRPICTARTPKQANCKFFKSAEAAEKAHFRPCLRCRPELAPGNAPVDDAQRIAGLLSYRLQEGLFEDETSIEDMAAQFELSSRQLRRIVQKELGVSPMELVATRRLLLAKQLLTETTLPIIEIAFASGFSSVRRFNDAFSKHYGLAPTRLRNSVRTSPHKASSTETLTLQLSYRPPFDWESLREFLKARTLKGVEVVAPDFYTRTIQLGTAKGFIVVKHLPNKSAISVELSHSLTSVLPALLGRIRNVFDLNARPDLIAAVLTQTPQLTAAVMGNPGLRVPGAFDGFELAVRAILGQQITVKAATTLAGRFVAAFGEPYQTPFPELSHLCPTPATIAQQKPEALSKLGIISSRARSIIALATEIASDRLRLEPSTHPDSIIKQLTAIPGIGTWTAHYIAMRALRWPDAFPKEDVVIRNRMGNISPKAAEQISQVWRPWRSYATLYLWKSVSSYDRDQLKNQSI